MALAVQVSSNLRAVIKQVRGMRSQMLGALRQGLNDENGKTLVALTIGRMGYSKAGPVMPDGLRRISSTAVRSLRYTPAVNDADGVSSSLGTNLRYVQAHEFGEHRKFFVPEHQRRVFKYGKARLVRFTNPVTGEAGTTTRRRRRVLKDEQGNDRTGTVRAHEIQMNLPARHMIRDTLAERWPAYQGTLEGAITGVWNQMLAVSATARPETGSAAT